MERKRSAADRSGIRRNLCAFANDLPGRETPGVIFIGVEDDGRCSGLQIDDRLLRDLAGMRDDGNILPLPSITVEKRRLDGCEVAVVTVQPSRDTPVRYMGRAWIKVGPTVREASPEEEQRLAERRRGRDQPFDLDVPAGTMRPIGYIVMQHAVRLDRPVKAYARWMARIPQVYAESVMGEHDQLGRAIDSDPHCLATLRHFRSLMPLAQEARKPMFKLKPADGAIGGHANAVADCRLDFVHLSLAVAERAGISLGKHATVTPPPGGQSGVGKADSN